MTWLAYSHLGVAKTVQLTTQPAVALAGIAFGVQPVGRLVDGSGVLSRATGVTVTASKASGTGTLSGTLSVQTVEGVFTFTDLKMDTVTSAVTLLFASSGLTSATSDAFNVTQPNTSIGCEVGVYALTGTAATLTRGPYMMRADAAGSYAVTGTSATLTGPAGSGTVLLSSDWSTATGQTTAAITDSGKTHGWDEFAYATINRLAVVAAPSGFPAGMTNVLRVTHPAGGQNYTQVQKFWTTPSVGDTVYYRWYYMCDVPNSETSTTTVPNSGYHPLETPSAPGSYSTNGEMVWAQNSRTDGTWQWRYEFQQHGGWMTVGTNGRTSPAYLPKFRPLRFEMEVRRIGTTTAGIDWRIYDESVSTSTPIYDRTNIWYWDFRGGTLHEGAIQNAEAYTDNITMDANGFRCIETGTNGGPWSPTAACYCYWGGFRVVNGGTWIGAYVPGES